MQRYTAIHSNTSETEKCHILFQGEKYFYPTNLLLDPLNLIDDISILLWKSMKNLEELNKIHGNFLTTVKK